MEVLWIEFSNANLVRSSKNICFDLKFYLDHFTMNIDLYIQLMTEIKNRVQSIADILNQKRTTTFQATNIEFMCLQIRKILELISLSSLVMNHELFEKEKIKYQKFWHAQRILNDIERLNPDFYPIPIITSPPIDKEAKFLLKEREDDFLSKADFVKIYEKCGKIMHADNPFGSKSDGVYYQNQIGIWLTKITKLLNCHKIKLADDDMFYLIHMYEKDDDLVRAYTFGRVKD
jgi:hypothetical protein